MNRRAAVLVAAVIWAVVGASCGAADQSPETTARAAKCVVGLHGKGEKGAPTTVSAGVADIHPSGNAAGWGARQWLYFPEANYLAARKLVVAAADASGCQRIVVDGFSNGAAFAAALLCHGETFDGRLLGVVVDDPVTDEGTSDCDRKPQVKAMLYWTGALDGQAPPGIDCAKIDWTCEGGKVIGITAYAARLALPVTPSPFTDHRWYTDAPELGEWLS